jgi:hypothetical protein
MTSFQKSCEERRFVDIQSKFTREKPMVYTMLPGILDD